LIVYKAADKYSNKDKIAVKVSLVTKNEISMTYLSKMDEKFLRKREMKSKFYTKRKTVIIYISSEKE